MTYIFNDFVKEINDLPYTESPIMLIDEQLPFLTVMKH